MNRLVVATLGTDQHPFDRLVRWLDALAVRTSCDVIVQHGHTDAPRVATGYDFLTHDRLLTLLRRADIVVCHGGPGTLIDAQQSGHAPVLVPRDPEFGEHVDGHQLRFAATIAASGRVQVAHDRVAFDALLDQRLSGAARPSGAVATHPDLSARGVRVLAAELDRLPYHPHRITPVLRSMRRAVQR